MRVIPAIDLREGACVQLVGGSYADERVRLEDPVAVARDWAARGFGCLHVVDLDAAMGRGDNQAAIAAILAARVAEIQVGGGVRTGGAIARLLDAGAARVIVGTRAIEEEDWIAATAREFPGVVIVAADARGRHVVTRGWTRSLESDVRDVVDRLGALPLAGIQVTAVHREGRMEGIDRDLVRSVIERSRLPVYAAGGIHSLDDLHALEEAGVAGAIVGMALYTGALDPRAVLGAFAS